MLFYFLLLLFIPMFISFAATPFVSRLAHKNGVVDEPCDRKLHCKAKPLLGGLSLYIASMVGILIFYPLDTQIYSLMIGATIVVVLGIFDDVIDINAFVKLAGQLSAATVMVLMNASSYGALIAFFNQFYIPGFLVIFAMIGWVVLLINAFNLIDGLDGLSVGTAAIIATAMAAIALIQGNFWLLGITLIGLGACLGFLPYNFNGAKIFMGDAGSMLLGFCLAVVHLFAITEPFSASLLLGSLFIFAYPALDTFYAIYRRLRHRQHIFQGDQSHIHHIILKLGVPLHRTVWLLYGFNFLFAAVGVLLLTLEVKSWLVLVIGALTVTFATALFKVLSRLSREQKAHIKTAHSSEPATEQARG